MQDHRGLLKQQTLVNITSSTRLEWTTSANQVLDRASSILQLSRDFWPTTSDVAAIYRWLGWHDSHSPLPDNTKRILVGHIIAAIQHRFATEWKGFPACNRSDLPVWPVWTLTWHQFSWTGDNKPPHNADWSLRPARERHPDNIVRHKDNIIKDFISSYNQLMAQPLPQLIFESISEGSFLVSNPTLPDIARGVAAALSHTRPPKHQTASKQKISRLRTIKDNSMSHATRAKSTTPHSLPKVPKFSTTEQSLSLDEKDKGSGEKSVEAANSESKVTTGDAKTTAVELLALRKVHDKILHERNSRLEKQNLLVKERDTLAIELDTLSAERDSLAAERNSLAAELDTAIRERDTQWSSLLEKQNHLITERDTLTTMLSKSSSELSTLTASLSAERTAHLATIKAGETLKSELSAACAAHQTIRSAYETLLSQQSENEADIKHLLTTLSTLLSSHDIQTHEAGPNVPAAKPAEQEAKLNIPGAGLDKTDPPAAGLEILRDKSTNPDSKLQTAQPKQSLLQAVPNASEAALDALRRENSALRIKRDTTNTEKETAVKALGVLLGSVQKETAEKKEWTGRLLGLCERFESLGSGKGMGACS